MPTPTRTASQSTRLTARLLLRILGNLIDALSRDMLITSVTRTPGGLLFTVTSRTRTGHTHQVCRLKPISDRPHPTYSCTCEHVLQIEEFTARNRHAHCWHVRFVHFLILPTPARRRLLTHPTGHPEITDHQRALRAVWRAYLERRRGELSQAAADRPSAQFIYALAARRPGGGATR